MRWLSFHAVAVIALLGGSPEAAQAATKVCVASGGRPTVTLDVDPGRVVVHRDRSRATIESLSPKASRSGSSSQWRQVGLTLSKLHYTLSTGVTVRSSGSRHCAELSEVKAYLGYASLDVYIAREYAPDTCQHRSIQAHENKHVAVFQESLRIFAPRFQRALDETASGLGSMKVGSPKEAAKRFQERLQRKLQPLLDQLQKEQAKANAALDSEQNYRREQARCPTW